MIIQVCEIYSDVINDNRQKQRELDFFKLADGFIFSTGYLGNLINIDNKPSCVCLGIYKIEHSYSAAFLTNDCIMLYMQVLWTLVKEVQRQECFYLKIILFMCLDLEVKRKLTIYVQS